MDGERTKSDFPERGNLIISKVLHGMWQIAPMSEACLRLLSLVVMNSFDIHSFAKGNFRMILMFDNFRT